MNSKTKTIRGRPKVAKAVCFIEPKPEPEPDPIILINEELSVESIIEPITDFLFELNNQNYNIQPVEAYDEDEYEEDTNQMVFSEEPEPENIHYEMIEPQPEPEQPPSQSTINLVNNIRLKRNQEPPVKTPRKSKTNADDEDDIFSKNGTEILGENKLLLINKITQYKQLFKAELKTFRIKKNANEEELEAFLAEMETIVSISSIDIFITDSILQTIRMIEGVSSYSNKYDVSGLAEILKNNPQFSNLTKQIYLKYNTFSKVPPEVQLGLLVITTGYVCNLQNKKKKNDFMNQPMFK